MPHDLRQPFWIMQALPAPAGHVCKLGSGVLVPAVVVPLDLSVWAGDPSKMGDGIGQLPQALLALAQRLRRFHRLGDIAAFDQRAGYIPQMIAYRLIDKINKTLFQIVTLLAAQLYRHRAVYERLSGNIYFIQQLKQILAL